jgi:hypothetical protein
MIKNFLITILSITLLIYVFCNHLYEKQNEGLIYMYNNKEAISDCIFKEKNKSLKDCGVKRLKETLPPYQQKGLVLIRYISKIIDSVDKVVGIK